MYKISDFKELIDKAKISRNPKLLNNVHTAVLEYLTTLQDQHKKNIRNRDYRLKSEITQLEDLNAIIFGIFAHLDKSTLDSKTKNK